MKKISFIMLIIGLIAVSCDLNKEQKAEENPFFTEWDTPHGTPPFDKIKVEHYMPAYQRALKELRAEVKAIASNPQEPTFENTITALDARGALLNTVDAIFNGMNGADTNEKIQEIAKNVAPLKSKQNDDTWLNENLWKRVKTLYGKKDQLNLNDEQLNLLDKFYKIFVRQGANLDEAAKGKLRIINKDLSLLTIQFEENVLAETNNFKMVIDNEKDLSGLPEAVIAGAAEAAKEAGMEGKWVFTTHKPSMIPFIQYAKNRGLREKIYKAYINRGDNGNEYDNNEIIRKIITLRTEKAKLLGYETYADYILEDRMSKNPENVYELLNKLWVPALKKAKQELAMMQKLAYKEGATFKLESWDWWYYAEKLKKAKYALDESMLRPYFKLENVLDGAFMVAEKLYGIKFIERNDIAKYHEDVRTFEVQEADGKHIGIFYTDYYPRASKNSGAWMDAFRKQWINKGEYVTPIIYNVGNFSKPVGGQPALLSYDEVETLFHELGHALHGLLSNTTYYTTSGTSVLRDFVELPSQILEHWAAHPDVLKMYAKHYETGEPIPDKLIKKLENAGHFNQGFATTEYLAASLLDMDYYTLTEIPEDFNVRDFETNALNNIGLIPEIISRYRSTYFKHIFSGGYAVGYHSYIWAEMLDADAFEAFKENGIFDQETALSFRENILAKGGTEEPMKLYLKFRGKKPVIEPLLANRGLN